MRDLLMIVLVAVCALFTGVSSTVLVLSFQKPKCECPCCTPVDGHRPLRPNGSMPGSTGSIGSLEAK